MWTVGRCIVYTGIRLLLLIYPFISSFFFLSNFQTLKFFVTLFSGTVRPRRLKLGTQVDSGQMYLVYRNQAAAAYLSLYFFNFLSLQFSNIKIFHHTFLSNCEALKVETCIVYTGIRLLLLIHSFISSFFFLSIFKAGLEKFSFFFSELRGLEGWNLVHMWTVARCVVYTRIRLLLPIHPFIFSSFFLSNFESGAIKNFIIFFWGTL